MACRFVWWEGLKRRGGRKGAFKFYRIYFEVFQENCLSWGSTWITLCWKVILVFCPEMPKIQCPPPPPPPALTLQAANINWANPIKPTNEAGPWSWGPKHHSGAHIPEEEEELLFMESWINSSHLTASWSRTAEEITLCKKFFSQQQEGWGRNTFLFYLFIPTLFLALT